MMFKWEGSKSSTVVILIFVLPAIAAAFLPKAIYSAVNGNFGDSWLGFTIFGIFFAMEIAGPVSILSSESHINVSVEIGKAGKLAE